MPLKDCHINHFSDVPLLCAGCPGIEEFVATCDGVLPTNVYFFYDGLVGFLGKGIFL